jgi:SPP1 gp7 family putative phage head morphogenesis protein
MPTANEKALDESIKDAVTLERMKAREVRDIISFMKKDFSPDYIAGLMASLSRIEGLPRDQQLRQLAGFMGFLDELALQKTDQLFNDVILENAQQTALISMTQQVDALNEAIPDQVLNLGFSVRGMTEGAINETVRNTLINGATIQETVTRFVEDFDGKVTDQLRMGINNGETITQLTSRVKEVINTKTNSAKTIARTVQTAVSAEVREETFDENSDVVKGYEWVSVLDTRTSDICRALDGEEYALDDPKRRKPPAHPNCRSTITPVLKSWKELGIDANELSAGTRRDMDGKSVSAELDYGEWLKTQSKAVQDEALGEDKAKLFRENNLDMKDFVNRIGEPLTVEQVQEKLARRKRRN